MEQIECKNLKDFVKEHADKIVIVDWSAEWCGPCKGQGEVFNELVEGKSLGDGVVVVTIDIDQDDECVDGYGIDVVPTLMFYKDGERQNLVDEDGDRVDRILGLYDADEILEIVNTLKK